MFTCKGSLALLAHIFQAEIASNSTKLRVEIILFKRLTCKSDIQSPGSSTPHWAPLSASAQGYPRPSDAPRAIASHFTPETSPQALFLPARGDPMALAVGMGWRSLD
jgi:hypothetical protein